jgi:hypothetical protein
MKRLLLMLAMISAQAYGAEWQFLGASNAGQHYVDAATLQWDEGKTAFSIDTRVVEKDGGVWLTTLDIACRDNRFAYLRGSHGQDGKTLARFDKPQPREAISAGSMPDQLYREYCRVADRKDIAWQALGKSEIATVYYDPASVRQHPDRTHFKADTRVQPFTGKMQTFSSLSFDCKAGTFTVLRMSKVIDGQTEQLFDKPQRAVSTSKTATLGALAGKYCAAPRSAAKPGQSGQASTSAECDKELDRLKAVEAQVQYDFDNNELQCSRAQKYLKQLRNVSAAIGKLGCAVADLDGYMQSVKQAGCGNDESDQR